MLLQNKMQKSLGICWFERGQIDDQVTCRLCFANIRRIHGLIRTSLNNKLSEPSPYFHFHIVSCAASPKSKKIYVHTMYLYALDLDLHYLPIQSEHQRKYIIY